MKVIMFQPRFAEMVRACRKRQTIRPLGGRPIYRGDMLSLRRWTGKPYRSPQEELLQAECRGVEVIRIEEDNIVWGGKRLPVSCVMVKILAERDGFNDAQEMLEWFRSTHGLPFDGVLITW